MFSRFTGFVGRHRRKFLAAGTLGAVAGGLVLLNRYAERRFREYQETEAQKFLERTRRQHHFESSERTANLTVQSFWVNLLDKLDERLDPTAITRTLAGKPKNKVELWEKLKEVTLARCVATIVGGAFLTVLVKTQINILGGYIYQETILDPNDNSNPRLKQSLQEKYLGLVTLYLTKGLEQLTSHIAAIVERAARDVSLKQQLSISDFDQLFRRIMSTLSEDSSLANPFRNPCSYLLPLDDGFNWSDMEKEDKERLKRMIADTMDVLESPDMKVVVKNACQSGVSLLIDRVVQQFGDRGAMPVAKIIPILNRVLARDVSKNGHSKADSWLLVFLNNDSIKMLSANVYESFCQPMDYASPAPKSHGTFSQMQQVFANVFL